MAGRIVIGGGSGFIGTHLCHMLKSKGYDLTVISRKSGPGIMTWTDLHRTGLPKDCVGVVNLSGNLLMDKWKRFDEKFKSDLHSSRIETTKALVRAVCEAEKPPKVFVGSSAVGYYPPHSSKEYTEDFKLDSPPDFMSNLCVDWEESLQIPANIPTRKVIVRIGLALGRDGGTISELIMPFFMGVGGPVGSGKQWFPWIHVDDVAGIITHAIENDNVTGVLNAVAPQAATNGEFAKSFGRAMWRPAFLPMPEFALRTVFGPERAKVMLEGQKVVPKKTLESGYEFLFPDLDTACSEFAHIVPGVRELKI